MKKIKISELPLYQSLKGLFVMGTDVNNRSVKVNLEFIESETTKAVKDADTATAAAAKAAGLADEATKTANAAALRADTAQPQRKPQPLQSQQPIKCLTRSERLFLRACLLRAFPA